MTTIKIADNFAYMSGTITRALVLWFVLLNFGCDSCDECGEPLVQNLGVAIEFNHLTRIQEIQDSLVIVDSVEVLNDSLMHIQIGLDTGNTTLEDEKLAVEALIDGLTTLRNEVNDLDSTLSAITTDLNAVITTINTNSLIVDQLVLLNTGESRIYSDSMVTYILPLSFTDGQSDYRIRIDGTDYFMSLTYVLEEEVNADRQFRLAATQVDTLNVSFLALDIEYGDSLVRAADDTQITAFF